MTKRWSSRLDDKYFNPKKEDKKYYLSETEQKVIKRALLKTIHILEEETLNNTHDDCGMASMLSNESIGN
jgi:hypothetical protein